MWHPWRVSYPETNGTCHHADSAEVLQVHFTSGARDGARPGAHLSRRLWDASRVGEGRQIGKPSTLRSGDIVTNEV